MTLSKLLKTFSPLLGLMAVMSVIMPSGLAHAAISTSVLSYENLTAGDDTSINVTGDSWYGQTFTTGATTPHTISEVRMKLYRVSEPGTFDVYIYDTDGTNPEGSAIGHGEIDGDGLTDINTGNWYTIDLDESVTLFTNTTYALVGKAQYGDGSNYVMWRADTGNGYAGGAEQYSSNGGSSWSTVGANDFMFEIKGLPALEIIGAKVFSGFLEDDDHLYVFTYNALAATAYTDANPQLYYNTQVVVNTTVVAQGKLPAWGYKPGSIYIAADEAPEWGGGCTIRISGISGQDFDGSTASYELQAADWIGDDLNSLDDWVFGTASALESYYGVTLITYEGGNQLLNDTGGAIFVKGIPGLAVERPRIFETVAEIEPFTAETHVETYQEEITGNMGEQAEDAFNDIGDLIGVSGGFVGAALGFYILILAIGAMTAATGHPIIAVSVCSPLLFVLAYLGMIPLTMAIVPAALLAAFALHKLFVREGV